MVTENCSLAWRLPIPTLVLLSAQAAWLRSAADRSISKKIAVRLSFIHS